MHVESRTRWSTADALAIIDSLKLPPLAPPRDDQMAPLPTSDMVPHPANAPQFTGTILPEEPVAQADVRRLGEPPPGEAPPKPERRDLTLDDLFTFQDHDAPDPANLTDAPADAPPARRAPPRPAPTPKLAPPRELRRGRPPSRGSSDLLNTFDGAPPRAARPTAVGPDPDAPRAQPVKLDQHPDGTLWAPEAPLPLPAALPDAPAGALSLLGQAHPADREAVIEHLATLDDVDVIRAMRAGARSTDVAMRAGVAIGLAGLQRTELASIARSLSGDRDPGVRSLAIHALGVIGRAAALTTLSRALADKDPLVRASAALAIAKAARAAAKAAMARTWLERAARDPDPMVGAAIAQALRWLS